MKNLKNFNRNTAGEADGMNYWKNNSRCRIWIRYLNMSIADKKRKNATEYEMVFHSVFGGIFLFVQLYVVRGMSKIVK